MKSKVANFKNLTIDNSALEKILNTILHDYQNIERINFRKITF